MLRALARYLAAFPLTILDVLTRPPTPPAAADPPSDAAAGAALCPTCQQHGTPDDICWECELLQPASEQPATIVCLTVAAIMGRLETMEARSQALEARIQALSERIEEILQ